MDLLAENKYAIGGAILGSVAATAIVSWNTERKVTKEVVDYYETESTFEHIIRSTTEWIANTAGNIIGTFTDALGANTMLLLLGAGAIALVIVLKVL